MILAAYLVTGFLVASIYAVGMLRGRRDRYHRLGLLIPLTVACIATPIQFAVGDTRRARDRQGPADQVRRDGVRADDLDARDGVHLRPLHGRRRQGRDRDPRARLVPRRLEHRHRGHRARHGPARGPAAGEHDAALGVRHDGRDLHDADRARAVARLRWWRKRDIPQTRWFLRAVAISGIASIVALECGWIVTEVGRQPWIVYNVMRTEDAVTDAERHLGHVRRRRRALRGAGGGDDRSRCGRCRGAGVRRTRATPTCPTARRRACRSAVPSGDAP